MTSKRRPFPVERDGVRGWRIAFLVLCVVGACLAADLVRLHVRVHTDPDYHSYCAMSERVNCETVAASDYAVLAGLPLSVWGLLTYVGLGTLAVWGLRSKLRVPSWPFGILFWLTLGGSAVGVVLFYISHYVIHSICIVCIGIYVVNVALFAVATVELRRRGIAPGAALRDEARSVSKRPRAVVALVAVLGLAVVALWAGVPRYWELDWETNAEGLAVGRTPEGHPWIGARQPVVEITEFSDYQCPHCLRGHDTLRALVRSRPDEVRLVHRHYPLDQQCNPIVQRPFHPFACAYSRLAFCAGEQNRFWEANDFLFERGRRSQAVSAVELAAAIELDSSALSACVAGERSRNAVDEDLREGRELGIRGTPTFVLDGRTYPGGIPQDVLDAALAR